MANHLDLVFLWHMHQPDYRDHAQAKATDSGASDLGEYAMPWVYLHATKDYCDMAAHLERHPQIRCVVNFVPVLLEQIEDYVEQFSSGRFRDPLLRLLATPDLTDLSLADRKLVLDSCFRNNHHTMLSPFPHYRRLYELHGQHAQDGENALNYLSGAYFSDLLVWYHLAWTGETERRQNALFANLMSKGEGYDATDRLALVDSIGQLLAGLIPRYRALAKNGQVELSSTPQTHPLAPLLIDFKVAQETQDKAPMPIAASYPGGHQRVCKQISAAQTSHSIRFGAPPVGMWPAEGAISADFVHHLADAGMQWIASGERVLKNSLVPAHAQGQSDPSPAVERAAYRPWQLPEVPGLTLFFRDERLSDLIGFDYAKWHGRDAAQHLVSELEAILDTSPEGETPVVSIILDGENAWEHYPYNGYYFFDDLYSLLAAHPRIRTTTFADVIARQPATSQLPRLVAGSWVYGTLSTWIGDVQKNRAWDLLCTAKQSYDMVLASGRLSAQESALATRQLAICESSDWFWWFGDYNPATSVSCFDRLYRRNLSSLFRLLGIEPPAQLELSISVGTSTSGAGSGAMRRAVDPQN